jgi:hypothetical protein
MAADLRYLAPEITSIVPSRGTTLGGASLIVRGRVFQPDTVVTIGNRQTPTAFINDTTLQVTLPPRPEGAGPVNVGVRNPRDGQVATLVSGFVYVFPPATE